MKKFEYMQHNIQNSNLLKYLNQYGDMGWCAIHIQPNKPNTPILENTVMTVTFVKEKNDDK